MLFLTPRHTVIRLSEEIWVNASLFVSCANVCACLFVCAGVLDFMEQMFRSLLQGSRVVKQPLWCAGIFTGIRCWIYVNPFPFFSSKNIHWLTSCFIYIPGIPAKIFSWVSSHLAITAAACLYFTEGADRVLVCLSSRHCNNCALCSSIKCQNIQLISSFYSYLGGCPFPTPTIASQYVLSPFVFAQPVFQPGWYRFFFCQFLSLHYCEKAKPADCRLDSDSFTSLQRVLSIDSLCLNPPLTHLSVSTASLVRQCAPLTWNSWLGCLMGGSRSRNHPSPFGHLFPMKSFRSQGADGCIQFMHLCLGCFLRTVRRKIRII